MIALSVIVRQKTINRSNNPRKPSIIVNTAIKVMSLHGQIYCPQAFAYVH